MFWLFKFAWIPSGKAEQRRELLESIVQKAEDVINDKLSKSFNLGKDASDYYYIFIVCGCVQ